MPLVKPLCFTQRAVTRVRTHLGTTDDGVQRHQLGTALCFHEELWPPSLSRESELTTALFPDKETHRALSLSLNERNYMFIVLRTIATRAGENGTSPLLLFSRRAARLTPAASRIALGTPGGIAWVVIHYYRPHTNCRPRAHVAHVLPLSVIGPKPLINSRPRISRVPKLSAATCY